MFFIIGSSAGRMIIIPFNRKGIFVIQMLFMGLGIYFDVNKERQKKDLYRLYYNYKQQLVKFKNLIVNDVSQAIAIVSKDLDSFLFINNMFYEFQSDQEKNVQDLLDQFIIQKKTLRIKNLTLERASSGPLKEAKRVYSAVLMSIMWEDQTCIAVMLHDITEQNTILSLLIADAHKDMMVAAVSHELRTPLNGMLEMI